jgi:hypothetical protein
VIYCTTILPSTIAALLLIAGTATKDPRRTATKDSHEGQPRRTATKDSHEGQPRRTATKDSHERQGCAAVRSHCNSKDNDVHQSHLAVRK